MATRSATTKKSRRRHATLAHERQRRGVAVYPLVIDRTIVELAERLGELKTSKMQDRRAVAAPRNSSKDFLASPIRATADPTDTLSESSVARQNCLSCTNAKPLARRLRLGEVHTVNYFPCSPRWKRTDTPTQLAQIDELAEADVVSKSQYSVGSASPLGDKLQSAPADLMPL